MSRSDTKVSTPKSSSQQNIARTVKQLNDAIDRLRDNILPKQPYLLSVPSDVPYRHSSRFVNNWHIGTPFERREEQLQYVSFLPHQEEDEDLLRVEGGWWDDTGQILEDEPSPKTIHPNDHKTPPESSQRKKITLKDYKTKDKALSPAQEESIEVQPLVEEHPQLDVMEIEGELKPERSTSRARDVVESLPSPKLNPSNSVASLPDGPPNLDGAGSPKSPRFDPEIAGSPRPAKRRKLSPSSVADAKTNLDKDWSKQVPQLLSPTLPSPRRDLSLPDLLSPELPPTLVKAIATPPSSSHERNHSHHRSDSVRSILAGAIGESSPRPSEKNGAATGSLNVSKVRSDSQHSARSNPSAEVPNPALAQVKSSVPKSKPGTPLLSATRSPGPRQRHIIALKYGKKNRKRIESLLKFAARPKKVATKAESEGRVPKSESKQQSDLKESHKVKSSSKDEGAQQPRPRSSNSMVEAIKRPTTPITTKTKDVGNSLSPSTARTTYHTPKKEFKSTAMRRVESTDGDPATPADRGRVSTPLASDRGSMLPKTSPAPGSTHSVKDEDRQGWNQLKDKYFQLGRIIKHEGQASSEQDPDPSKSLAMLVEALLCFMMNLATQSGARPNVDPGWRTILPYHIFLFRASRKIPILHGLVMQLGAVCRQIIHKYDMDRLGKDPLPDDHLGSAPTPGSDGNTKTNEDSEKYKKKYLAFRDDLVQNAKELQTAWLDGCRHLSPEVVQRDFPRTWNQRLKDYRNRGTEKPTPSKMAAGFYLPLDPSSTAFEAVQFGLALLGEWSNSEEVDWRPRLEL